MLERSTLRQSSLHSAFSQCCFHRLLPWRSPNKPDLAWQIKTRNERRIPIVPELVDILNFVIGDRSTGPVFMRRRFGGAVQPPLRGRGRDDLQMELAGRFEAVEAENATPLDRPERQRIARRLWMDMGAVKTDRLRAEFMQITSKIGMYTTTAPKTLRHMFATALQDANVDPLIRNELMGHVPAGTATCRCSS